MRRSIVVDSPPGMTSPSRPSSCSGSRTSTAFDAEPTQHVDVLTKRTLERENPDPRWRLTHARIVSTSTVLLRARGRPSRPRAVLSTAVHPGSLRHGRTCTLPRDGDRPRPGVRSGAARARGRPLGGGAGSSSSGSSRRERSPEALEGYGLALWFLGEMERGVELCQQSCLAFGEAEPATAPRGSPCGSRTST